MESEINGAEIVGIAAILNADSSVCEQWKVLLTNVHLQDYVADFKLFLHREMSYKALFHDILMKWKAKFQKDATIAKICSILEDGGHKDAAERVRAGVLNGTLGIDHMGDSNPVLIEEGLLFNVTKPIYRFAGRRKELIDLHTCLTVSATAAVAVVGLGGIGKTTLVRKYIEDRGVTTFCGNVVWINCDNESAIKESFVRLATDTLGIPALDAFGKPKTVSVLVTQAYGVLFQKKACLLVFDNAELCQYIYSYFPLSIYNPYGNKIYTVITSRFREWSNGIVKYDLQDFSQSDAMSFVKKGLNITNNEVEDDIETLITQLQRFPLALEQAVAYIEDKQITGNYQVKDYTNLYESKSSEFLQSNLMNGLDDQYTKTAFTTWEITMEKIVRETNAELAIHIMQIAAYLFPDNIDKKLFVYLDDTEDLELAIRLLVKHSMLSATTHMEVLSIHRVVQTVIQSKLRIVEVEQESLMDAYSCLHEYTRKQPFAIFHIEKVLHHFDRLCQVEQDLETRKPSRSLIKKLKTWKTKRKFSDNKRAVRNLIKWATEHESIQKDVQKSITLLQRALAIEEEYFGPDHENVAPVLNNLGVAYGDLGDVPKQIEILQRSLKIQEQHFGKDHEEVAIALTNLSTAYAEVGNIDKRKPLLEKAVQIFEKACLQHNFFPVALNNLGNLYGEIGETEKAKCFLKRALQIEEERHGKDNVEVALTIANLGCAHGKAGEIVEQRALLERALNILDKAYGPESIHLAKTLSNLGVCYGKLGLMDLERKLLGRALPILEKHYGTEHPNVAVALSNLGAAFARLGEYDKQKDLLERAVLIKKRHFGDNDIQVATTEHNLALAYGSLGNVCQEALLLEKVLRIEEKHYGLDNVNITTTLVNLGNACCTLGFHGAAKAHLERALKIEEGHYGKQNYAITKTLASLGNCLGALGDPSGQLELLSKAVIIQENHYGKEHYETAKSRCGIANAHGDLGNPQKKLTLLENAIRVLEIHYGRDHLEVARPLADLGNAHGALGEQEKRKEFLEKALAIQERKCGPKSLQAARTMEHLADALGNLGNVVKQSELIQRALQIKHNHLAACEQAGLQPTRC